MHIKQLALPTLLILAALLGGCAMNNDSKIDRQPAVTSDQQVNMSTPVAAPNQQTAGSLSNSLPGAQLGLYLKPQLVRTQIVRLHREYPQAFSSLNFVMTQRENKGVTLYGLRVGPFQDYTEANTFCLIAQNMGQKCTSAPFVGQPL